MYFKRDFQIWQYSVSHSQLLLRSVKGNKHKTRIDVLFKGVDLMHIPTHFSGFRISEIAKEEFQSLQLSLGLSDDFEDRYFRVEGEGWKGVVVALAVFWVEEDAEHNEKSKLFDAPSAPYV